MLNGTGSSIVLVGGCVCVHRLAVQPSRAVPLYVREISCMGLVILVPPMFSGMALSCAHHRRISCAVLYGTEMHQMSV